MPVPRAKAHNLISKNSGRRAVSHLHRRPIDRGTVRVLGRRLTGSFESSAFGRRKIGQQFERRIKNKNDEKTTENISKTMFALVADGVCVWHQLFGNAIVESEMSSCVTQNRPKTYDWRLYCNRFRNKFLSQPPRPLTYARRPINVRHLSRHCAVAPEKTSRVKSSMTHQSIRLNLSVASRPARL